MSSKSPPRTAVLWCPDWPVVAAEIVDGVPATDPVVVLHANRVVACSEAARFDGVRRGLRKREAQSRCPQLVAVDHDPVRDVRAFEPVVAAVEEIDRRGGGDPSRHPRARRPRAGPLLRRRGGGRRADRRARRPGVRGGGPGRHRRGRVRGRATPPGPGRSSRPAAHPGSSPPRPSSRWLDPPLVDLLRRLGVRTLGEFAALPAGDVLARFGFDAALAHRLAAGGDQRPLAARRPPPDLPVSEVYDDPLERVDVAAFAARSLAERLHDKLAGYGLACTRLGIEAVTAHGQELHRVWRHDGLLTTVAIADRVRWQLDGWLTGTARRGGAPPSRPTAGIMRLRLIPEGVVAHASLQPGLWGEDGGGAESARTGRSAGCRASSARSRWSPRSWAAAAHRPIRCGWCRGATSAARPGRASHRGRAGSRRPPLRWCCPRHCRPTVRDADRLAGRGERRGSRSPRSRPRSRWAPAGRRRSPAGPGRGRSTNGGGRPARAAAARGSRSPWPTAARCCCS